MQAVVDHAPAGVADAPVRRRARPVLLWAGLGATFLAIECYVLSRWILSGPVRTSPGPSEVPLYMKIALIAWIVLSVVSLVLFLWFVLIKPWRAEGRITTDGLLTLAFLTLYWQDFLSNSAVGMFTYNAWLPNFGNWAGSIPGWLSPNGHLMPEPIILILPTYAWIVFGMTIVACNAMQRAKQRWPGLSTPGLVLWTYGAFIVFDIVLELLMIWSGIWVYTGGAIKGLTLFYDSYYRVPLTEGFMWGGVWTLWTMVRYFKNDKGQTIMERGLERVRVKDRGRTALRFLSFVAVINVIYLFGYNIPYGFLAVHGSGVPQDIQSRSYFSNGICGPGSTVQCPGAETPIARRDGARVGPDGTLVSPEGRPMNCDELGICRLVDRPAE